MGSVRERRPTHVCAMERTGARDRVAPLHVGVHLLQGSKEPAQKRIEPAPVVDALALELQARLEPARQRLGQREAA